MSSKICRHRRTGGDRALDLRQLQNQTTFDKKVLDSTSSKSFVSSHQTFSMESLFSDKDRHTCVISVVGVGHVQLFVVEPSRNALLNRRIKSLRSGSSHCSSRIGVRTEYRTPLDTEQLSVQYSDIISMSHSKGIVCGRGYIGPIVHHGSG